MIYPRFHYIRTPRPAKDLLFKLIKNDLKKLGRVNSVGDIGCAELAFFDWFNCEKYFAYDIDIQRPEKIANNLQEEIHLSEFDITKNKTDKKHSLIFCIQVMIGNISFDMTEIENAISNLIKSTKKKGSLIFNLKTNDHNFIENLRLELEEKFYNVKIIRYGEFNFRIRYPLSRILGTILFWIYKLGFNSNKNRYYIFAENRKD